MVPSERLERISGTVAVCACVLAVRVAVCVRVWMRVRSEQRGIAHV